MKLSKTITKPTKKIKRRRALRVALALFIVIIGIRLALPYLLLHYVNKNLAAIEGYYGHVRDIDLSLYRGAYIVKDIFINKVDTATKKQTPLFSCPHVDLSIEWRSLFKRRIVSEMEFSSPVLRFTEDATELEQMEKDTNDFRRMLKTFTPSMVNRVEVFNGQIAYLDNTVTPVVNLHLDNAHILARNLYNVVDTTLLPAVIKGTAEVYEGSMILNMRIDALANDPTYDLDVEVKNANLVGMNDFFKAYGDFDINKGSFGLFMELAAKDRKYIGYVKPFITDLDVVGPEDRKNSILQKIWEAIVGISVDIVKNHKTGTLATKVPIVGEYGDQSIGKWYAVVSAIRNGFVQALYPSLDYQVTIGSVQAVSPKESNKEGLYKKVFGKPGENKKKEE